jgi:hypothetical protein
MLFSRRSFRSRFFSYRSNVYNDLCRWFFNSNRSRINSDNRCRILSGCWKTAF